MTILSSRERLNDDLNDLKLRIAKMNARRNAQINLLRRNITGGSFRNKLYTKPKDFYRRLYFNDPSLYPLAYPWRSSSLDSLLLDKYYEDDLRKSAILDYDYEFYDKYNRPAESNADLLSKLKDFVFEQEREVTNDLIRKVADRRYAQERSFLDRKLNTTSLKSSDQSPLKRDPPFLNPINKKDNFYKRYNAFVKKILRPLRKSSPHKSYENISKVTGTSVPYRPTYSRSYLDYDPFYRPRWYWYSSPLYRRYLRDYDYLPKIQPATVPRDVESIIQSKCDNRTKVAKDSFFPAPASYKYDPFESDSYLRYNLPTWKQYYYTQKLRSKPSNERYLDYYDPYHDFFPDEASVNSTEELFNEEGAVDDAEKLVDEYRDAIYEDIIRNLRNKQGRGKPKKPPRLASDRRLFGYRINEPKEADELPPNYLNNLYENPYTGGERWKNETKFGVDDGLAPVPPNFTNTAPKNEDIMYKSFTDSTYNTKYSPSTDYKESLKHVQKERSPGTEYYSKYEKSDTKPENICKLDRANGHVTGETLCRSYVDDNALKSSDKYRTWNAHKNSEDSVLPSQKLGSSFMQKSYRPTFTDEDSHTTEKNTTGGTYKNTRPRPPERGENDPAFEKHSTEGVSKGGRVQPSNTTEELYTDRYSGQSQSLENGNTPSANVTKSAAECGRIQPLEPKREFHGTNQQPRSSAFENNDTTYQNYLARNPIKTRPIKPEPENASLYSPKYTTEHPRYASQTYSQVKNEDESFQKYIPDEPGTANKQIGSSVIENETGYSRGYSPENSKHSISRKFSTAKNDDSYPPEPAKQVTPSVSKSDSNRYLPESGRQMNQRQSSIHENETFQEYVPENMSPNRRIRSSLTENEDLSSKYPPSIPRTVTKLPTEHNSYSNYPAAGQPIENRRTSVSDNNSFSLSSTSKEDSLTRPVLQENLSPPLKSPPKMIQKMKPSATENENIATHENYQSPPRRRISTSKNEDSPRSPTKELRQPNLSGREDESLHNYRTESPTKTKLHRSVTLENESKLNDQSADIYSLADNTNEPSYSAPPTNLEDPLPFTRASTVQSRPPSASNDLVERVALSRRNSTVSVQQSGVDVPQGAPARRSSIKPTLPRRNSTQSLGSAANRSPEKIQSHSTDSYSIEEVTEPVERPSSQRPASLNTPTDHQIESINKSQESVNENNSYHSRNSKEAYDPSQEVSSGYPNDGYYDQHPQSYEMSSKDMRSQDTYGTVGQPQDDLIQQFYDQRYSIPGNGNPANYDANYNYYPTHDGYPGGYGYDSTNYHAPPTNPAYMQQEYADYTYPQQPEPPCDFVDPRNTSGYAQEYDKDPSYHRSSLPHSSDDFTGQELEERNFVTPYDQYTVDQKEPDRSLNSIDENSNSMSLNESSKKQEPDSTDEVTHEISIEDSSAADSNPSKSTDPPKSTPRAKDTLVRRSSRYALSSQSSEEKKSKVVPQTSDLQKRTSRTKLAESKLKRMPSSVKNKPAVKKT